MNKTALGAILGAALLGLSKKGSSARRMSLDDFFKKKVGNQDQTFKIHFRIRYFPRVEYDEDDDECDIIIYNDFDYHINSFLYFIDNVASHIIEYDQDFAGEDVDVWHYFDGTIGYFGEQWLDGGPLGIMEAVEWKEAKTIFDNSRMDVTFFDEELLYEGEDIKDSIADGYLEVKLNLDTFNFRQGDFEFYIEKVIENAYDHWLDNWQDPDYVSSNCVVVQITKVEPDIFFEKKSNLRIR